MDKVSKQEKAFSVYDLENDKFVDVSLEQQRTAAYFHNQVLLGAFVSAIAIKRIFDDRLYLAMGCQSRDEYIENSLPFNRRQCYKLLAVADKFESVTKSFDNNNLLTDGKSNSSKEVQSTALGVSSLGIEKLYELSKIDDAEIDKLIKKGKIKIDGEDFSIDDLKEMSAKEVAHQIKKATKQYQEKLKKVETENIQLKETKKLLENENAHLIKENDEGKDAENTFGPVATTFKNKKERLNIARDLLNKFDNTIMRCGVTEEDPDGIQKDLVDIIAKVDEVHQRIIDVFGIITTRF